MPDSHKDSISTAVAEEGRKGEVRDTGAISNDLHALEKFIARLRKAHGADVVIRACYEAGPCGFGIARRFKQLGIDCMVVAPSMTPTRSGDRIKTDKRDARKLARLLRAGELTAVYIPEPTDEAIRDLCRARTDAVDDRRRARHRLKAFLLRHGYRYHGKSALDRSAPALPARAGAAASGHESDSGGVSDGHRGRARAHRAL
jgi:transposase